MPVIKRVLVHLHAEGQPVTTEWQEIPYSSQKEMVRPFRNSRLAATDWTQLPDVPEATRLKWQAYRQALRDMPENTPDDVAFENEADLPWPQMPE